MLAVLILLCAAQVFADTARSAVKSSSAVITTVPGIFFGVTIKTNGANDVIVNIYDGTDASGKHLIPVDTLVSRDFTFGLPLRYYPGIEFKNGLYIEIESDGAFSYQVIFQGGNVRWGM